MSDVMLEYFGKTLMLDEQHMIAWEKTLTFIFDKVSDAMIPV